jgi:hypothetical protein
MRWLRTYFGEAFLVLVALALGRTPAAADIPAWLPRYDLNVRLDVDGHLVHVRERVTWTNRHQRPADEIVFNAHSHYQVAKDDVGFMAKTLELLRMRPSDALEDYRLPPPMQVHAIAIGGQKLAFHFQQAKAGPLPVEPSQGQDDGTALVVALPRPVRNGESVTFDVEFTLRLPPKQGRWGQWLGVTTLSNWLPVVAVYDEEGWHPTPFIPWHQPWFNEAGIYSVRVELPSDQKIACSAVIAQEKDLGNGWKCVDFAPCCCRDFALLSSARYQEFAGEVCGVHVRCLALPGHEYFGREMLRWVCEAIPEYNRWFGPYPAPQFTIAESYFGWNGNECGNLVMIDERVFGMPHMAGPFLEYLISHELCHQWWYNAVGTNGYCETWMDEALATYFSHRLITKKHGRDNAMINYPRGLEWLPNIHRENYRIYSLYGVLGRGDAMPTVQNMENYGHLVNLLAMNYDKGSKIVGMIEDRLGETAFLDFMRRIYARYQFRILRLADFQRELEEYTGRSWDEFFKHWLYGAGMTDWAVERVKVKPIRDAWGVDRGAWGVGSTAHGPRPTPHAYRATVLLHQKAEYNEPTVLGISLDGSDNYQIRIPIQPDAHVLELQDPPARVEALCDNQVRVVVDLPCQPTQISVDPDQVLVDRNPANNHWKPLVRWRFAPFNTMLEETDVTNSYDRLNVVFGPGLFFSAYNDPWYTRSPMAALRGALYRTQDFDIGAYTGYRTDYNDIVVGADGLIDHWPWPHTQVGFNAERRISGFDDSDPNYGRVVLFGRYVIKGQYTSSLYLPPMHYVELFGGIQDHNLPEPRQFIPGADHFNHQTTTGIHYHLDYLTPYWDPEGGFRVDATYATGIPILAEHEAFNKVQGEFSYVYGLPEQIGPIPLGPLSETRLAARIFGGAGLPNKGEYFTLGGSTLFRGFDLKERQGSAVWVGSLEWRVPLAKRVNWDFCDHVIGVRNVYLAPFYDVGNAYVNGHELGPVAHAVGAGLRINIALFSLIEQSTLRFDVAKTLNSSAPWQFWFGFTVPF